MVDIDDCFTAAEVMAATGIAPDVLKMWVSRKPAVILMDEAPRFRGVKGRPIQYSANRIMQIAITMEIVKLGLTPRNAALVAFAFTDQTNIWPVERPPGRLFEVGDTVIVRRGATASVVNVQKAEDMALAIGTGPAIAVTVNPVYHRIMKALGR